MHIWHMSVPCCAVSVATQVLAAADDRRSTYCNSVTHNTAAVQGVTKVHTPNQLQIFQTFSFSFKIYFQLSK